MTYTVTFGIGTLGIGLGLSALILLQLWFMTGLLQKVFLNQPLTRAEKVLAVLLVIYFGVNSFKSTINFLTNL